MIDTIVLFGATGDLSRKLLFPALYRLEERNDLDQRIIGIALDDWSQERFSNHVDEAIRSAIPDTDPSALARLTSRLHYVSGDYSDRATFSRLGTEVGRGKRSLHYLAIPPSLFETVAEGLSDAGLLDGTGRLLVEKPFGRDLETARELNRVLHRFADEKNIYRIDHFLGKEPVENLLAFRYANPILDAVWNRNYIDRVEVTMSEAFGVDGRGALYDRLGVVRDVVQNHILQIISLLAMEAPVAPDADSYADERAKVFRAMASIDQAGVIYGQYDGYRDVEHVAPDSTTATYASFAATINTPRWYGVPFQITAGKHLATTETKAEIIFKASPPLPFAPEIAPPGPNRLVFRIGPSDGVDLMMQTKTPGPGLDLTTTPLSVDYEQIFGRIPLAYERVIDDALAGNRSQFARQDVVEEAWRIVDRISEPTSQPLSYAPGGKGPKAL